MNIGDRGAHMLYELFVLFCFVGQKNNSDGCSGTPVPGRRPSAVSLLYVQVLLHDAEWTEAVLI
jgi:hypothetical protein